MNRASSSQIASSSTSQTSRATPRVIAPSDFPTTPTPPTRRQSSGRYSAYHKNDDDEDREETSLQAGPSTSSQPSRTLKRTASKAALQQPPSPATKLLTTPKKRPYTGPIHDPNPINPFAASPLRRSAIKTSENDSQSQTAVASPFFHATSPMKLKELLQENSLRKVQERNGTSPVKEITPRTKARKRLTGEIEETPAKSRVRRKRGAGPGVETSVLAPGLNGHSKPSKLGEMDDEDEDEFGPTPIKPTTRQEGFHSFFELDNGTSAGPSRGTLSRTGSSDMVGRLLAAGGKGKGKASIDKVSSGHGSGNGHEDGESIADSSTGLSKSNGIDAVVDDADTEGEVAPPWEEEMDASGPSKSKARPASRPDKTLSISDDELDEWDPEASHVKHRVRIVPTRTRPKKHWSDSDDESIPEDNLKNVVEAESDEGIPALDDTTTSQTNLSVQSPPQLLSLLSLTSPNQRQGRYAKLKELRYKALFNPSGADARKLKAFTKGQEAFVAGEAEDEDEEEVVEVEEEGHGVRADDDWESESDGWNRTGVEMDDDAW